MNTAQSNHNNNTGRPWSPETTYRQLITERKYKNILSKEEQFYTTEAFQFV